MSSAEQVPTVVGPSDFNDPRQEWRRLFSELFGVLAAAGGGMMAIILFAIILFMGKLSGAHLNPAASIAFAVRRDFPWQRVSECRSTVFRCVMRAK